MTHGVCRVHDRGLPKCMIMKEQTTEAAKALARGSVKAAVLKGDSVVKDMVAFAVYDTKPVHFISTAATSLKWKEKKRRVYNTRSNKITEISYLRTQMQDDYNNGMNDVDISDQLRKNYCFNRWLRNRKWWWAILMWGWGVLIVNTYVAYVAANICIWKKQKKNLLTHYNFRKSIALALIAPEELEDNDKASKDTRESVSVGRPRKRQVSFVTTRSVARKPNQKACRVNDKTLDPTQGALQCRLNSNVPHFPHDDVDKIRNKALRCALHRWVDRDTQIKRDVMVCSTCKVALCVRCFRKFHTESDVNKLRDYVKSTNTEVLAEDITNIS